MLAAMALAAGIGGGIAYERLAPAISAAQGRAVDDRKILYWVAPMDPSYRRPGPGKSPMGMDLIPIYEGAERGAPAVEDAGVVRLSSAVVNNLGVREGTVTRVAFGGDLRTVGYVALDEEQTSHIHVRKEGWIESLRIRSLGSEVAKGDLLFEFFSPELASASFEYVRELQRGSSGFPAGARAKLKALGVTERQVQEIGASRKPADRIRIHAPQGGVVVQLGVGEGMYIRPDQTLMTLSDLSTVWVIADVFESQTTRVSRGMEAEARLAHLPEDVWRGRVDYVYPEMDPVTRTLRVRLRFPNPGLKLRPNMFADVTLKTQARAGIVAVPTEAVIRTGTSERVVLALGGGRYKAAKITVGRQWKGLSEVISGLEEGARVVLSGQFLIDSEASLTAGFARLDAPQPAPAAPAATPKILAETHAVINTVDIAARRINVSHEPIPTLGWPAMTMDFGLVAQLNPLAMKSGTRVVLGIARDDAGNFVVATLAPARETTP
jgi:Cu(I)/Ag(I) efflux system membrane fusion protein